MFWYITKHFNDALKDGYFPDKLKWADVTPVFEKYDPTKAKNYRPVSVLPGEVFERLMHKQIIFYTDQFLSPNMCGNRSDFSTQHALLSLIEKSLKVLHWWGNTNGSFKSLGHYQSWSLNSLNYMFTVFQRSHWN